MIHNIWFQIGILILVNLIVIPFKFDYKFFVIPTVIWSTFILSTIFITKKQDQKFRIAENEYWEFVETNENESYELYKELNDKRKKYSKERLNLIHLVVFQSFLVFVWQIIGQRKFKEKKIYRWTTIFYGLTAIACLILEFLISIVPTGRIV